MPLKVIDSRGNDITTLEQWSKTVRRSHWKRGRSAYSLADFIMNRNGAAHLESRISSVLSQPVRLEQGTPEYAARFDRYEGPARLGVGSLWRAGPVGEEAQKSVAPAQRPGDTADFGDNTAIRPPHVSSRDTKAKPPQGRQKPGFSFLRVAAWGESRGPETSSTMIRGGRKPPAERNESS